MGLQGVTPIFRSVNPCVVISMAGGCCSGDSCLCGDCVSGDSCLAGECCLAGERPLLGDRGGGGSCGSCCC